jgi:hypothetical protein
MDSSSYTRRLQSRSLAHGTYAKGVSDGELVARRSARLVQECCSSSASDSQQPITDPLAFIFNIDQTRSIRTMTLILTGSGVILNGSTQIRFTGSYFGTITVGARVSIYSGNLSDLAFLFSTPTYHSMTGYYIPSLQTIRFRENNYITSIVFTQDASNLTSITTSDEFGLGTQPLQITSFDCVNLPALETLVLANQNGPLNAILNAPSSLKDLQVSGNSITGIFSVPGAGLEQLICSENRITGLSNVPTTLTSLSIGNTDISGIFSLAAMPNLELLDIQNTRVYGLSNIPVSLKSLYINQTDISGVLSLASIPALEILSAFDTRISSLTNIPTTIQNINLNSTDISGVFDLTGLSNLTSLNVAFTSTTGLTNIPVSLIDINLENANLDQTATDAIAASLDANGASDGSLVIENQQGGPINITGSSYVNLTAKGWTIT